MDVSSRSQSHGRFLWCDFSSQHHGNKVLMISSLTKLSILAKAYISPQYFLILSKVYSFFALPAAASHSQNSPHSITSGYKLLGETASVTYTATSALESHSIFFSGVLTITHPEHRNVCNESGFYFTLRKQRMLH